MVVLPRSLWLRWIVLFGLTLTLVLAPLSRSAPADADLDRRVAEARSYIESQTGHRFTHPIVITNDDSYQRDYIRVDASGEHALATSRAALRDPADPSLWVDIRVLEGRTGRESSGDWEACLIVVADAWTGLLEPAKRSNIAHEVYHCYQREKVGALSPLPPWVLEGSASWAGETYAGGSPLGEGRWRQYLTSYSQIEDRSYDAQGVFAHMTYSGESTWNLLDRALTPPLPPAAAEAEWIERFLGLMANRDGFLQTWAMGLERNSSQRDWNTDGPGITGDRREVVALAIPQGRRITRTIQRLYSLTLPEAQVVSVQVFDGGHGAIRWGDRDTTRISGSFNQRYCLGDTCTCPDGSRPAGVTAVDSPTAIIALTGYPSNAELGIDPVENPCEEEEPEVPGPSSDWGSEGDRAHGTSYGDPHIITYDGYRYSFQTIGEYWLTAATDGHFQVQARQGQIPGRPLSMNTAVAVAVGGHRLAIYAQNLPDGRSPVWLDGSPFALGEGPTSLPGGGVALRVGDRYQITWPTGESLQVSQTTMGGAPFLTLSPEVPRRAGTYQGLLGNLNRNPDDDLQIRGGAVIPPKNAYASVTRLVQGLIPAPVPLTQLQNAFFEQLYRQFGDSWRVTAGESLFDYGPGQSTATFTQRNFPSQFPTLVGVAPAQIQNATRLCQEAGVNEWMLEGCVFDVAATGQPDFVQSAVNAIATNLVDEVQDQVEDEIRRRVPIPLPRFPF
ncbi:VWD domain-containing protein [Nodosilinea sp. LEGE 07088]|uniref:VWD domain-containing protein n=1 Tax=Nodosilinea sp. LEGE 07088 TaxID=2777968 RepID=UPI00187E5F99|nr:VWD domain-containing protein [Nodosilinea sp. LEGE 07088]MBE9141164.1 VWD domain-containing protein [Nodosilinea sp. LEGE 07088]